MIDRIKQALIDGKQRQKWKEDINRRKKATMYLDFYNNLHAQYIQKEIEKRIDPLEVVKLLNYIEYDNITASMIEDISLLFQERPAIEIKDAADPIADLFTDFTDEIMLVPTLRDVNKYVNLNRICGVYPQVREGKIELDIITSNMFFVEQDESDPTKLTAVYIKIGEIRNTSSRSEQVDLYHKLDATGKYLCRVDIDNGNIEVIEEVEAPDFGGKIPIIFFKNYIPVDDFFLDWSSPIVDKNLQIDLRLTALNMMEDMNIPQLVKLGAKKDENLKLGLTFFHVIEFLTGYSANPMLGDVKYISPDSPVEKEWDLIQNRTLRLATSLGLSQDSIKGESFTSGYHLALSKQKIIAKNKAERDYYTKSIKDLFEILFMLTQYTDNYKKLNEKMHVKINYGEPRFDESPLIKEQVRTLRKANGTQNEIDFMMEDDPDLTREEATKLYKEKQAEVKAFSATERFIEALGQNE